MITIFMNYNYFYKMFDIRKVLKWHKFIYQADRASVEKKLEKKLASAHIPARTKAQRKVSALISLQNVENTWVTCVPLNE